MGLFCFVMFVVLGFGVGCWFALLCLCCVAVAVLCCCVAVGLRCGVVLCMSGFGVSAVVAVVVCCV